MNVMMSTPIHEYQNRRTMIISKSHTHIIVIRQTNHVNQVFEDFKDHDIKNLPCFPVGGGKGDRDIEISNWRFFGMGGERRERRIEMQVESR